MRSYLLGELDDESRLFLEQSLMIDDDQFELLLVAEDELMDDYISDSLSRSECERFESVYLATPLHRQNLSFARDLRDNINRNQAPSQQLKAENPLFKAMNGLRNALQANLEIRGYVVAAGCLILILSGAGLVIKSVGSRNRANQPVTGGISPDQDLARQLAELKSGKEEIEKDYQSSMAVAALSRVGEPSEQISASVFFTLAPGAATRSIDLNAGRREIENLSIPAGTRELKLRLDLEQDQYPNYRATLLTGGGMIVKQLYGLLPQSRAGVKSLSITFPADIFKDGGYLINLDGFTADRHFEPADRYSFAVRVN